MQSFALLSRLLFWSVVTLAMVGIAVWLVRRIRGDVLARRDNRDQAEQMLREFTSMKADGQLDDREYRAIRERLQSVMGPSKASRPTPGRKA